MDFRDFFEDYGREPLTLERDVCSTCRLELPVSGECC